MIKKRGFTIIELLVVTTIISLLATLGITTYASLGKQSRDAKRKGDLENVRAALEQYKNDTNYYPGLMTTLVPSKYLIAVPADPKSGTASYVYCPATDGSGNVINYDLCSTLESGGSLKSCCAMCGSSNCMYKLTPLGSQ
ncbi:MAG: prepilin-type N-terminal cleavage/methylation domain-containing protein [Patescibacteria group bacterium]|jgi:general secretion pathway protein G